MRVNPNLSARAQGVWYPQPQLRLRAGCIAQRSDYATIWRGRVFKDFGVVKLYGSTDAVGDTFVQRGSARISTNDQDTAALAALKATGCERLFREKTSRPR